ncbi:hypothetical protein RvY_11187 [Ramazzottius varieornatus]|uniref:Uncharacterized protein n=1 Tax=Ramazzottius varieornatus TaxID=947166 RepID=A0A1D1VFA8_RAMVA|nr:hypothetical protein RvY_11187 [Ramazzottius varieornatus]
MLKNFLGLPKLLYVLRCSPNWKAPAALQTFDDLLRRSVAEITNKSMNGFTWLEASLSVSMGGLGIRRTERIALPAFMASIHSVQALVLSIYPESDLDSVVNDGLDHWPLLTSAELPVPALRR